MPDWVPPHITGGIEANGTFAVETDLGRARVHAGNVIIERCGTVWVREEVEVRDFICTLNSLHESEIANVGPGKVRQFGTTSRTSRVKGSISKTVEKRPKYLPPVGSQPSIEWIHLNRLSIDGAYQRSTDNVSSQRLIASIAAKFDWRLCAPLVVSRRLDDTLRIIDGQHRWMAACRREDIPQLPCCVFRYESIQEEARMFIVANRARKPMNRLDDYFAALAASDEDALEIQQLVSDAGLQIARNTSSTAWRPGEVAFTSAIAEAIRRFGSAITSAVLTNMAVAFPGQKLGHGGAIFGGLMKFMSHPGREIDPDRLMNVLVTRTAEDWGTCVAGLKGGDTRSAAIYEAIVEAYETKLRVGELRPNRRRIERWPINRKAAS
jgi:hypothetical protein